MVKYHDKSNNDICHERKKTMSEEQKVNEEAPKTNTSEIPEISLEEALKPLVDGFKAFGQDAKEAFADFGTEASKGWTELKGDTEKVVKENPILAISAAAGLGLLIGLVGTRRR
jgi:ElaB/YqjD/DUF883 family membrane-anchored ribosome-binding protein